MVLYSEYTHVSCTDYHTQTTSSVHGAESFLRS